jgi:hypothetical protein
MGGKVRAVHGSTRPVGVARARGSGRDANRTRPHARPPVETRTRIQSARWTHQLQTLERPVEDTVWLFFIIRATDFDFSSSIKCLRERGSRYPPPASVPNTSDD